MFLQLNLKTTHWHDIVKLYSKNDAQNQLKDLCPLEKIDTEIGYTAVKLHEEIVGIAGVF